MNIVILGSSGSIGTQCLSLLKDHPEHKVIGLSVKSKIELLKEQAGEWQVPKLCVYEEALAEKLSADLDMPVSSGMEGLIELATLPEADMVVVALVGMIGILPTISAIKAGKKIALANKETLVCAGHLIMPMLSEYRAELFPIDSEHSAIWQCLRGEEEKSVESLLLTASGGPFFGLKKEEMEGKTKADALKHPNWSMGQKITIDSATMVNKGLEMMEAHWLFNIPMEKIQVVIQRESILHSAVVFQDGAVKGQMGVPDMRLPIAYALFQEERECYREQRIDFSKAFSLHFFPPSLEDFPGLALGMKAGAKGGSMPTVYNAANEEAVRLFLEDKIRFMEIPRSIAHCMKEHERAWNEFPSVEEIFETERWAREEVRRLHKEDKN